MAVKLQSNKHEKMLSDDISIEKATKYVNKIKKKNSKDKYMALMDKHIAYGVIFFLFFAVIFPFDEIRDQLGDLTRVKLIFSFVMLACVAYNMMFVKLWEIMRERELNK